MSFLSRRSREGTTNVRHVRHDVDDGGALFRRSRTLTGSVVSSVASATESRSHLRSPRLKEHDLRQHRRKLVGALVGLVLVSGCLVWLLRQYTVQVTLDPSSPTAGRYTSAVYTYLNDHPEQRLLPLLSQSALSAYVSSQAPEVESVRIVDTGFWRDTVHITYRTAVARWQIGDAQYYVDASGIAFDRNVGAQPLLTVVDESGLPAASQQIIASTKMMRFIGLVVGKLGTSIGAVSKITVPPATLREVDIECSGRPYKIRLNIDRDPVGQATDVIAAIRHLDQTGVVPKYVDARVEGKAFYIAQ